MAGSRPMLIETGRARPRRSAFDPELVDVAAGDEVDAQPVRTLHAEAVDGDVGLAGLGSSARSRPMLK